MTLPQETRLTGTAYILMRLDALPAEIEAAETAWLKARGALAEMRATFGALEAGLLMSGEIVGKNEAERKADLHLRLEPVRIELRRVEFLADEAEIAFNRVKNEFNALRAMARILGGRDDG